MQQSYILIFSNLDFFFGGEGGVNIFFNSYNFRIFWN